MANKTSLMMGLDGLPADEVRTDPATPEDLASFERASEQMSRFEAPALFKPNNPHSYMLMGLMDGTGNDFDNDPAHQTNVARVRKQLDDLKKTELGSRIQYEYTAGPGTQDVEPAKTLDNATGRTSLGRAEEMYVRLMRQAEKIYRLDPKAEFVIHLEGFSRGASQVPLLARMIDERGIPHPGANVIGQSDSGLPIYDKYIQKPGMTPMSVGLYDPVPTGYMEMFDRRLPKSVVSGFQLTSIHERRGLFPSDQIIPLGLSEDGRFLNVWVAGVHSDVGGGYLRNGLAIRSFNLMTDYHNHLLGEPLLMRLHEPLDPRMNGIHRSIDGMHGLYKWSSQVDRATPDGQIRQISPDTSRFARPGEVVHTPAQLPEALRVELRRIVEEATPIQRTATIAPAALTEGDTLAARLRQLPNVELQPYKPSFLERASVRTGGALGAAGVAMMAYDFTTSGHKWVRLQSQGNVAGADSTASHFVGRNVGGAVGGFVAGTGFGLATGSWSGPGAIATGVIGGAVGAWMGDRWAEQKDIERVYTQTDATGRTWTRDPEDPQGRWLFAARQQQVQANDLGSGVEVRPVQNATGQEVFYRHQYVADGRLERQLNYQAANASYELGLANPPPTLNPFRLDASSEKHPPHAPFETERAFVRDTQTSQWHLEIKEMIDGKVPVSRIAEDPISPERVQQLEQQSKLIIAQNAANSPAAMASRYMVAYEEFRFGDFSNGVPPPAILEAQSKTDTLRASDGNDYTRQADGSWISKGVVYDSAANRNLTEELDLTWKSQQSGLRDMQVMIDYAKANPQVEPEGIRGQVAALYQRHGIERSEAQLDAAALAVERNQARDGLQQQAFTLELMQDPRTRSLDANSAIATFADDGSNRMVLRSTTTAEDMIAQAQHLPQQAPTPDAPEHRIEAQSPQERDAYAQALSEANRQGVLAPDAAQIATLAAVQVRAPGREETKEPPQVEPEARPERVVDAEQQTRAVEPAPPAIEPQPQQPEKVAREPEQPQMATTTAEPSGQERTTQVPTPVQPEQPAPAIATTPSPRIDAQQPQEPVQTAPPQHQAPAHDQPPQKVSDVPVVDPQQPEPVVDASTPEQPGLRPGDRGNDVEFLQYRLQKAGALGFGGQPVPMDGIYGIETEHAVRQFQQANGLPATGVADRSLDEALARAPQVRQEPTATVEPEQPARVAPGQAAGHQAPAVHSAPEQVVERASPEQREDQAHAIAEAQRLGATPDQVQQVASQSLEGTRTAVEPPVELPEQNRAYASPSLGGTGRSIERDEPEEPTPRQSQSQSFPTDHHDYALFVAIQQQLPKDTSDEKTAEILHQAKLGGIERAEQLDEVVVENNKVLVFGNTRTSGDYSEEVMLDAQAPALNDTLQQTQAFDQQQALQLQQFNQQQALINQNPNGPTMTM